MAEASPRKLVAILAADIAGYSSLMGLNEARTVSDLKAHQAIILPMLGEFGGRLIDTAGDGILAEFTSVVNALECAVTIQNTMAKRNAPVEESRRMLFRMGVNVGDVIYDDERIYGDGINIAARLESIAEPGSVYLSRLVHDQVEGKVNLTFRALGPQPLKNIVKPVEVFAVVGTAASEDAARRDPAKLYQDTEYCRTPGGVRLAYSIGGSGPPLVKAANWMNHLEYDWESPIHGPLVQGLARDFSLIRYDARGNGLSDWDVESLSLDDWVQDLATVVDAVGIERFPILGMSQGCAISIAYAARYPERISHLILYGGYALGGKKRSQAEKEKREAMETLIRHEWGSDSPAIRQMFTSLLTPEATHEQAASFNELQRRTTSPECAARYFAVVGDLDVREDLGKVRAPTLVMHARDDRSSPFEAGRAMAAGIPGARFIALQGQNHIPLEHDQSFERFLEEIRLFLSP